MLASLLAQASDWSAPAIDYHALAPEIIVGVGIFFLLLIEVNLSERNKWVTAAFSGLVLLLALVPVVTLAVDDAYSRSLFDGRYVVDEWSLALKALFLISGYIVVLLSTTYVEEGDYYEGEYYLLLLTSILGMLLMTSARDLISVFIALEVLSIPVYMLAAWRKRDEHSNEAGVKYYLLGVFASAVMLYGMSLLYGVTNSTLLADIGRQITVEGKFSAVEALAIVFVIIGFAFKVSAVPFHQWAPDVYEGAPTPITAFLSVASKAAGFVAIVTVVYVAFPQGSDVWQPVFWVLAVLTMTVGNLLALRQTNIVRLLAYSSISQGGFIIMPLAVAGTAAASSLQAIMVYLLVYAATNLGVFAVILAVSRRTRSGAISSYDGLFSYSSGLAVLMTIFLASLAGIPPLAGWIGKFSSFKAVLDAGTGWAYVLAVIAAINTVIAFGYYGGLMRTMWMRPAPEGDTRPIRVPAALGAALVITGIATIALGVLPGLVTRFGDLSDLTGALGR
jgi:NADH-quinone oxidoreductase subunit N